MRRAIAPGRKGDAPGVAPAPAPRFYARPGGGACGARPLPHGARLPGPLPCRRRPRMGIDGHARDNWRPGSAFLGDRALSGTRKARRFTALIGLIAAVGAADARLGWDLEAHIYFLLRRGGVICSRNRTIAWERKDRAARWGHLRHIKIYIFRRGDRSRRGL